MIIVFVLYYNGKRICLKVLQNKVLVTMLKYSENCFNLFKEYSAVLTSVFVCDCIVLSFIAWSNMSERSFTQKYSLKLKMMCCLLDDNVRFCNSQ